MAPAILNRCRKILFLDAYDSFSNNIVALVEQNTDADVVKIFIDDPSLAEHITTGDRTTFTNFLAGFDAVIAGPGPGWAKCDQDVGLMKELWQVHDDCLRPVLGICLGFQSLCLAFGARTERLVEPKHGIVSTVLHESQSIFRGIEQVLATQYHSLHIQIGHPVQTQRAVTYPAQLWEATESCPQLEPIAWDFDCNQNGAVLMGVKHTHKPFWGVQFHPESICTNDQGKRIIRNWWEDVQCWNRKRIFRNLPRHDLLSTGPPLPKTVNDIRHELGFNHTRELYNHNHVYTHRDDDDQTPDVDSDQLLPKELALLISYGDGQSLPSLPPEVVESAILPSGSSTVADICEILDISRSEAIVLESGLQSDLSPMATGTGRTSIIGIIIPEETLRIHYYAGTKRLELRDGNDEVHSAWHVSDPWPYIRAVMQHLQPLKKPEFANWAPFWGGLMGYASYEAGLETINVSGYEEASYPDICFAYITRSIIIDHEYKQILIQSIRGSSDYSWITETIETLKEHKNYQSPDSMDNPNHHSTMKQYIDSCHQATADVGVYCDKVRACQEAIADGHSYELCLTTRNEVRAKRPTACRISRSESNEHSWKLYKRLSGQNPAPFSAYMRLHNVHILSSSPERYISWDRSQHAQCRPIKGTVQKKIGVAADDARAILSSSKERAENLMIVDLTRHQLHDVYGSEGVNVSKLMEVEEYETLWQLVSVVDAAPPDNHKTHEEGDEQVGGHSKDGFVPYLGFEAFAKSLPPGSMTGAPKKRSCQILQDIEHGVRRGIYSGVLGYLDVGGGGDFSVVIRTAIKIDDDQSDDKEDVWQIGAGGAVTSQSTPEGEYEEMVAKFGSTNRAFQDLPPPKRETGRRVVEIIEPDSPHFAELLASMRGGDELSLDNAQIILRTVERELRRRTDGDEDEDDDLDHDQEDNEGVDIEWVV